MQRYVDVSLSSLSLLQDLQESTPENWQVVSPSSGAPSLFLSSSPSPKLSPIPLSSLSSNTANTANSNATLSTPTSSAELEYDLAKTTVIEKALLPNSAFPCFRLGNNTTSFDDNENGKGNDNGDGNSLSPDVSLVYRATRIIENFSPKEVLAVISSVNCRKSWDASFDSSSTLTSFTTGDDTVNSAEIQINNLVFSWLLGSRLTVNTSITATTEMKTSFNDEFDNTDDNDNLTQSSSSNKREVIWCASSSIPKSWIPEALELNESELNETKWNKSQISDASCTLKLGGFVLQEVDPYSMQQHPIPSTKLTIYFAMDLNTWVPFANSWNQVSYIQHWVSGIQQQLESAGVPPVIVVGQGSEIASTASNSSGAYEFRIKLSDPVMFNIDTRLWSKTNGYSISTEMLSNHAGNDVSIQYEMTETRGGRFAQDESESQNKLHRFRIWTNVIYFSDDDEVNAREMRVVFKPLDSPGKVKKMVVYLNGTEMFIKRAGATAPTTATTSVNVTTPKQIFSEPEVDTDLDFEEQLSDRSVTPNHARPKSSLRQTPSLAKQLHSLPPSRAPSTKPSPLRTYNTTTELRTPTKQTTDSIPPSPTTNGARADLLLTMAGIPSPTHSRSGSTSRITIRRQVRHVKVQVNMDRPKRYSLLTVLFSMFVFFMIGLSLRITVVKPSIIGIRKCSDWEAYYDNGRVWRVDLWTKAVVHTGVAAGVWLDNNVVSVVSQEFLGRKVSLLDKYRKSPWDFVSRLWTDATSSSANYSAMETMGFGEITTEDEGDVEAHNTDGIGKFLYNLEMKRFVNTVNGWFGRAKRFVLGL